jgi:hypothetical protein
MAEQQDGCKTHEGKLHPSVARGHTDKKLPETPKSQRMPLKSLQTDDVDMNRYY